MMPMSDSAVRMPYWRLSSYYFFYFASLGALVPYWGLYLQERGFEPLAIGQLLAILSGTKIIAPMIWGHVVDLFGRRMGMVRWSALLSALAFVAVFGASGFWNMAASMLLFSFFWNASLPQVEAVTFNHLRRRPTRYALVRLWGSVGFILVVVGLGQSIGHDSLSIVPTWLLALLIGVWLATLAIPDSEPVHPAGAAQTLLGLLRQPGVIAFFAACFLLQVSHGIYYGFYSIHLEAAGYSGAAVGWLWALGVVAEVLIFLVMHRLLERFGARRVLMASLAIAVVRWLSIGAFIDVLAIQLIAQTLHAATFGTFHASAIHLVHHAFPGRTQGRGQALYNSLSFGAGGAVGNLLGGALWSGTDPMTTFGAGALMAALALVVSWRWMKSDWGV